MGTQLDQAITFLRDSKWGYAGGWIDLSYSLCVLDKLILEWF